MIAFFNSVSEILVMVGNLILNLFKTIFLIFTAIPKAIIYLTSCVAFLPPFVLAVVTVCIAVCIANLLLNGGKNG